MCHNKQWIQIHPIFPVLLDLFFQAVVVISCETAEQEENKRQLIREYLEGAQSLEEEIEFSFQESAWLADEANLLCSTVRRSQENDTSSDAKVVT